MNEKKLLLVGGCVALLALIGSVAVLVYPMFRHSAWVNDRLEAFAGFSYEDWRAIHDACAGLVEGGETYSVGFGQDGERELPDVIQRLEPMSVRVLPGRVSIRFSGGHARFVHIEYSGDPKPAELQLLADGLFHGRVYPSEDQRPLSDRSDVD